MVGPERLLEIEEQDVQGVEADGVANSQGTQASEYNDATVSGGSNQEEAARMDKEYKPEGRDKSYYELERKLSEQGAELGQYRKFYEEAAPVIEFIQNDEQILNTVLDKLYGRESSADADTQTVQTENVGEQRQIQQKNQQASDDIIRYVDDRIKSWEEKQKFEQQVDSFIESHPDFHEKLPKIMEVIDRYGIEKDIELAYKLATYDELQSKIGDQKRAQQERKVQAESISGAPQAAQGDLPTNDPVWDVLGKPVNPYSGFDAF